MKFVLLADYPQAAATVARWYHGQWGYLTPSESADTIAAKLERFMNRDRVPLLVLGVDGDAPVAAAELKFREMDIYPEKEHWIGGVFVVPGHRHRGLGARVVERVADIARLLGVQTLHLQTERLDGGLYARLGWSPLEQVNYKGLDVLVMARALGGRAPHAAD
jgi:GNAT superfamily N-acetyltransferase